MFNMPVSSRRRVYNLSSGEHLLKCLFFILPRENLTHKWECMHWIKLGSLNIIHSSILFKHDNEKLSEFLFVSMAERAMWGSIPQTFFCISLPRFNLWCRACMYCSTISRGPKNPKKETQFWAKRGPKIHFFQNCSQRKNTENLYINDALA